MWKTLAVATTVLTLAASAPALSQTVCSDRASFLAQLNGRYHENPVALGLASSGAVLEVLASKGGTWTILVTQPNGTSCVVATGEAWQGLTPASAIGPSA